METSAPNRPPATGRRRRRSSQDLRRQILQAAAAEFEIHGLVGATTAGIARRADVTEAQLFRMFRSKTNLFRAAVFEPLSAHIAAFHDQHDADARGASREALATRYTRELQDFLGQHHRMLMSLVVADAYRGDGDPQDLDALHRYFDRGATMMRERAETAAETHPELLVRISFAAVLGAIAFRELLFPPALADDEAINRAVAAFVVKGIGGSG